MTLHLLVLLVGCALLYVGGEQLVRGASTSGARLGLSPGLIGLLLVSLGTSAPELFVSAGAALQGYGDVAVGNALGSNIVNICLVLGIGALLAPLPIAWDVRDRQLPLMLVLTALVLALLVDGRLGRIDGAVLLGVTAAGLAWLTRCDGRANVSRIGEAAFVTAVDGAGTDEKGASSPDGAGTASNAFSSAVLPLFVGVVVLALGAEALIFGGVGLAAALGVPEAVIALTVTSVGTGLPEITATAIAASRREHEMAIGNVVGSNIMNLGLVLGGSAVLRPLAITDVDATTFGVLGGLSALAFAIAWWPGRVSRALGASLVAGYALYVLAL